MCYVADVFGAEVQVSKAGLLNTVNGLETLARYAL